MGPQERRRSLAPRACGAGHRHRAREDGPPRLRKAAVIRGRQPGVEAHFFLFLLAYYNLFEIQARLASMLYTDEAPLTPADPVAPAQRSRTARAKAATHRTPDGHPAHSLQDLIKDLGTLCRNTIRIGKSAHTFTRLTTPTALQAKAFELVGVNPSK